MNLFRIRKYFTDASSSRVLKAVELKKKMNYYCQVCMKDPEQEEKGLVSICCDRCLQWLYLPCAGLKLRNSKVEGIVLSVVQKQCSHHKEAKD